MSILQVTRFRAVRARPAAFGRAAGSLCLAALACAALACSDDDSEPAEQTGAAGEVNAADASVRVLRGDGREPTPDSDTDTRQREPIGPDRLVETIEDIRNGIRGDGSGSSVVDAAAPVGDLDAGTD